jgi:seryl-tRNA synthetase
VIDLKRLRQDPEGSRASLLRRRDSSVSQSVDALLTLDRERRDLLVRVESLKAERNAASEEVARRKRAKEPADELMARLKTSGEEVKALDARLREVEAELERRALTLPNFPADVVPDGDASANRIVRSWGEPSAFEFQPKPHWELAAALGILDLPGGAKLTGSGFPLFRGLGSRLVRAMAAFMLDLHSHEHGYVEIAPPVLVNRTTLSSSFPQPRCRSPISTGTRSWRRRICRWAMSPSLPASAARPVPTARTLAA